MDKKLKEKLKAEVAWAYARSGAFQRSRIYDRNAEDEGKENFRATVKQFLFEEVFTKNYGEKVTEKRLLNIINRLVRLHKGNKVLSGNKLRFGNAQKFVNLYLKCMWVCGYIKTPPHFPIDRIMINRLKLKNNWTNMNITQYKKVIFVATSQLKRDSKYGTIAEWEAYEYQENYIDKE